MGVHKIIMNLAPSSVLFVDHYSDSFATGQHKFIVRIIKVTLFVSFRFWGRIGLKGLLRFRVTRDTTFVGEFTNLAHRVNITVSSTSDAIISNGFFLKRSVCGLVTPCQTAIIILNGVPIKNGNSLKFLLMIILGIHFGNVFIGFDDLEFSGKTSGYVLLDRVGLEGSGVDDPGFELGFGGGGSGGSGGSGSPAEGYLLEADGLLLGKD